MLKLIRNLRKNEAGATAIEYGLIAALVAIAAIGALGAVGTSLTEKFEEVDTALQDGAPAAP